VMRCGRTATWRAIRGIAMTSKCISISAIFIKLKGRLRSGWKIYILKIVVIRIHIPGIFIINGIIMMIVRSIICSSTIISVDVVCIILSAVIIIVIMLIAGRRLRIVPRSCVCFILFVMCAVMGKEGKATTPFAEIVRTPNNDSIFHFVFPPILLKFGSYDVSRD
jgi:hypothetical protein